METVAVDSGDAAATAQAIPWVCREAIAPRIWREVGAAVPPVGPATGLADAADPAALTALHVEFNGSAGCYGGWELLLPVPAATGTAVPFVSFEIEVEASGLARTPDCLVVEAFWYGPAGPDAGHVDWDPVLLDGVEAGVSATDDAVLRVRFAKRLRRPAGATQLGVRCGIRWSATGRTRWSGWRLRRDPDRPARRLRLGVASGRPAAWTGQAGNVDHYLRLCRLAGEAGVDLVTLPETILSWGRPGRSPIDVYASAVPLPGPWLEPFQDAARTHRMGICFSVYERGGERDEVVYNTALLLGRDGELRGTYRKVHLAIAEVRLGITPGQTFPVHDFDGVQVGLGICMDSAAAETARILAQSGAEVMLMPIMSDFRASPWDATQVWRRDRWELIQRAHAFDNYLYCVVARNVNQGSAITAPWGEILAFNEGDRDVIWADVDVDDWRKHPLGTSIPAVLWSMRRPVTYGSLTDAFQPVGPPAHRR